jgi:voltage-gated potassium channel
MDSETRLEARLDRVVARATSPRGAALVIAATSTAVTFAAAFLVTLFDREEYPSLGAGLWWAVQTVTTVGYGDEVPTSVEGRLVAALVMLFGIGFLTVITAAITSTFVARSRREKSLTTEKLDQIEAQLERIEDALTRRSS